MNVDFTISLHAAARIEQRGVRLEWIRRTILHPDRIDSDLDDPDLRLAYKRFHKPRRIVLCVVYNHLKQPPHVVTVFFEES